MQRLCPGIARRGLHLHRQTIASDATDTRPLVILHGLFGSLSNFGTPARRLASGRKTILADLRNHGESKEQTLLTYTYRNEPRAEHRPRSAPHRGACEFTVVGRLPKYITGTYWTDRFTVGDMDLTYVDRKKDRQSLADLPLS